MIKDKLISEFLPGLIKSITEAFEHLGLKNHPTLDSLKSFNKAYQAVENLDGRSIAWSPERRAKHAAKVKATVEARNYGSFKVWQFSDVPPNEFNCLEDVAAYMGTNAHSLRVLKSRTGGLGVIKQKNPREVMVFAQTEENMKKLLNFKHVKTGNPDHIIVLPTKNPKSF